MADVIVIGAGLAGLAAAYRLQNRGLDVQVIERGPVAGGYVRTVRREEWRHEWGPNSFLASAEALRKLAEDVGVTPVAASPLANKRFLFLDGRVQAMPGSPPAAITTGVLPFGAKLRVLLEPFTRVRPTETDSIRAFFEARIGREATERFVDAFVSGVYASDISETSVAAAFPKLYELGKSHGSLIRGFLSQPRPPRDAQKKPAVRGTFSFAGGLGDLPAALAAKLGNRLHLGADVRLSREGAQWRAGEIVAPTLILATPAYVSASLLAHQAPALADALTRVHYNPIAGVHLLFRREDVPHPLDGFGFLAPQREKLQILGCIWSSSLFQVCGPDRVALTCFLGGAHAPALVREPDEAIVERTRADLTKALGIKGAPVDVNIVKHTHAIPQYGLNHLALRAEIRERAAAVPGLFLAGNYLEGVSMSDTVAQGEKAATEAAASPVLRQERAA
jgi:oxygen-dependent protoporphyrinogen oxidase